MTQPMLNVDFQFSGRVRQIETDASGYVHFANYVRYMEETEYAYLRSHGLSVEIRDDRGVIGFPRTRTELKIERPLERDTEFEVWMRVALNDGVQIHYEFEISVDGQVAVTGRFEVACCRFPKKELPRAILIPDFVMRRIRVAEH